MHSTSAPTARRRVLQRLLGLTWPNIIETSPVLESLKSNHDASPFAHYRFTTRRHGKMLCFRTGNCIRAGKHTHGDACWAAFRFQWWLFNTTKRRCSPWPTAVSCPNAVLTGELAKPNSVAAVQAHPSASSSTKFPGVALTVPDCPSLTPELFPKSGKFICPGATTVSSVHLALAHIADIGGTDGKDNLRGAPAT